MTCSSKHTSLLILLGAVIALFCASFLFSCDDNDSQDPKTSKDPRLGLIEDAWDRVLEPSLVALESKTETLNASIHSYCDTPSTDTLKVAQNAWKTAYLTLKKQEVFKFGAYRASKLGSLNTFLDSWPLDNKRFEKIWTQDYQPKSEEELKTLRDTRFIGFNVVEYLLFEKPAGETGEDPKRCIYLNRQGDLLSELTSQLYNDWKPENPKGHLNYFLRPKDYPNNEYSDLAMAAGEFVNALWHTLDTIERDRLGHPIGLRNMHGNTNPNYVEARYAGVGLAALKVSLETDYELYRGNENTQYATSDQVAEANPQLDKDIRKGFEDLIAELNQFSDPLSAEINPKQEQLKTFVEHLKALKHLIEVDVMSALGLSRSLNETDGD